MAEKNLEKEREEILGEIDKNLKQRKILLEAYKKIQAEIKKEEQKELKKAKDKILGGK